MHSAVMHVQRHCRASVFQSRKAAHVSRARSSTAKLPTCCNQKPCARPDSHTAPAKDSTILGSPLVLSVLTASYLFCDAALAVDSFVPSYDPKSYYVSLGLFVMTVPGLYSLIKRAPKSKIDRKVYEVAGPATEGAVSLDDRARQVFRYFKKYNYEVKGTGEVIRFVGTYAADRGQASALVFYTFCSLAATALVLSITVPQVGDWWYAMTLLSPAAGAYYWSQGTREEEVKVKMVTADDDKTTDIIVEADREELERMSKELGLVEKGKVYVKGLLETLGSTQ